MDFDLYRKRMSIQGGNESQAFENETINFVNDSFSKSPFYAKVPINGVITEVRINSGDTTDDKLILFRPHNSVAKGSYVQYSGYNWLVTDTIDDDDNRIYPTAKMQRCNNMVVVNGNSYPCIIQIVSKERETLTYAQFPLMHGSFYGLVQYNNDTQNISEQDRYKFGTRTYEVSGVDPFSYVINGYGYVFFALQPVTGHTGTVIDNNNPPSNTNGGGLW